MNPDRVFYKCPNHRVILQLCHRFGCFESLLFRIWFEFVMLFGQRGGCNFFHWEDGEDSYVDYLVSIGATEVEDEEEMTKEGEDSGDNTGVKILDL